MLLNRKPLYYKFRHFWLAIIAKPLIITLIIFDVFES